MRKVLHTALLAVAASMTLTAPALADTDTADLVVARDACGGSTDNAPRLDWFPGSFTGACGSLAAFASPTTGSFGSATLDPLFALDTERPIVVAVSMSSRERLGYGIGAQTVRVTLTAKDTNNKTVTLGSGEHVRDAAAMLGGANYVAEIPLPLTAAKAGPFKSYALTLEAGGAVGAGYVSYSGDSLVSLPVLDGTVTQKPDPDEGEL